MSEKRVWWPVEIHVPQDGGRWEVCTAKALFQPLLPGEAKQILAALEQDTSRLEFVARHVHDWREIGDENGAPLDFNAENLRTVLGGPLYVFSAFEHALVECSQAQVMVGDLSIASN